jgi:hypothetical protein
MEPQIVGKDTHFIVATTIVPMSSPAFNGQPETIVSSNHTLLE